MSDAAEGLTSASEDATSESKSAATAALSAEEETQKALKKQKKKNAVDMKNALKRKKRLQGKASQLSDTDLVEVLRMRKAKKESEKAASKDAKTSVSVGK